MAILILKERCPQNHTCPAVKICPAGALKQSGFRVPEVKTEICTSCAQCVKFCPMGAFKQDNK